MTESEGNSSDGPRLTVREGVHPTAPLQTMRPPQGGSGVPAVSKPASPPLAPSGQTSDKQ